MPSTARTSRGVRPFTLNVRSAATRANAFESTSDTSQAGFRDLIAAPITPAPQPKSSTVPLTTPCPRMRKSTRATCLNAAMVAGTTLPCVNPAVNADTR